LGRQGREHLDVPTDTNNESAFGLANASAGLGPSADHWLGGLSGGGANGAGFYLYRDEVWFNSAAVGALASQTSVNGTPFFLAMNVLASSIEWRISLDGTTWSSAITSGKPTGSLFFTAGLFNSGDVATIDFDPAPDTWELAGQRHPAVPAKRIHKTNGSCRAAAYQAQLLWYHGRGPILREHL
jgi:hypothetical protein